MVVLETKRYLKCCIKGWFKLKFWFSELLKKSFKKVVKKFGGYKNKF